MVSEGLDHGHGSVGCVGPFVVALVLFSAPGAASATHGRFMVRSATRGAPRESAPSLEGFGSAVYPDWPPPPTWDTLGHGLPQGDVADRLGSPCGANGTSSHFHDSGLGALGTIGCGDKLVCREGLCRHCVVDEECQADHVCSKYFVGMDVCMPREKEVWDRVAEGDLGEILCTLLVMFASGVAAIAGVSGGGVFVPIFLILSSVLPESAVPLSQCLTACGSLVNVLTFLNQRYPGTHAGAKIDYDCVALFQPMLVLGVILGVFLHEVVPRWLVLLLLCLTLATALWRVAAKGIQQFQDEAAVLTLDVSPPEASEPFDTWFMDAATAYVADSVELMSGSATQLMVIVFVWTLALLYSSQNEQVCTAAFLRGLLLLAASLAGCTALAQRYAIADSGMWKAASTPRDSANFGLIALGAGVLGGTCGMGGGIIVGPVLLELGLPAEVVQATTSLFVLLSSSLATVRFAVADHLVWHYALWYGAAAIVAAVVGLRVCDVAIRKHRRLSIIPLSIAAILLASLVALAFAGSLQVAKDIDAGERLTFSVSRLCQQRGAGIITVGVAPSPRLPHLSFPV